jgi:Flp pilus assembly pilin Flp
MPFLRRLLRETEATTAVEYAVLLALILMSVIAAVSTVGSQSGGLWSNIKGQLQNTSFGSGS